MMTVVITGANVGIGFATAKVVASLPQWHVVLACRNISKAVQNKFLLAIHLDIVEVPDSAESQSRRNAGSKVTRPSRPCCSPSTIFSTTRTSTSSEPNSRSSNTFATPSRSRGITSHCGPGAQAGLCRQTRPSIHSSRRQRSLASQNRAANRTGRRGHRRSGALADRASGADRVFGNPVSTERSRDRPQHRGRDLPAGHSLHGLENSLGAQQGLGFHGFLDRHCHRRLGQLPARALDRHVVSPARRGGESQSRAGYPDCDALVIVIGALLFFAWNQKLKAYPFTILHAGPLAGCMVFGYQSLQARKARSRPASRVFLKACRKPLHDPYPARNG